MSFVSPGRSLRQCLTLQLRSRGIATGMDAEEAGDIKIPFGQHQGKPLRSLPQGYLRVLARMGRSKWGMLAEEVLKDLGLGECHMKANAALEQEAFVRLLGNATSVEAIERFRARIEGSEFRSDPELINTLIQVYGNYGCLDRAKHVLGSMDDPTAAAWNTMMLLYVENNSIDDAKGAFDEMPVRDAVSWIAMFKAYLKFGHQELARVAFDLMPMHDLDSTMETMDVLLRSNECDQVKLLYDRMLERDIRAWNCMIRANAEFGHLYIHLQEAKSTAEKMPEWDMVTVNTMLDAYTSRGYIQEAERLFDEFPERDEDAVTTMMRAFSLSGRSDAAQAMFDSILHPSEDLWGNLIAAYARDGLPEEAKSRFESVPSKSELSWSVLLEEYARNLQLEDAEMLFDKFPKWTVRSQVAMISAYSQTGHEQMTRIVFNKCSGYGAGVWNAFTAGLTLLGRARDAIQILRGMNNEGFAPDEYTFLNLLNSCRLIRQGRSLFREMLADYGLNPWKEHYTAMIDLLGRVKNLHRARDLINNMPFEPDYTTWSRFFHACRQHGDSNLVVRSAKELIRSDPTSSALPYAYTALAESYAAAGKQDKLAVIQRMMERSGITITKQCGAASWILVKNRFQEFVPGDAAGYPQHSEICAQLGELSDKIVEAGYRADMDEMSNEKQDMRVDLDLDLDHHSEKIALAFGMISSSRPGSSLRVINSSRVCSDCHSVFKFASQVTGRLIVLRDGDRIHHFDRGKCSCSRD